jgi:two-component system CitB family sensor kinase
VAGVTLADAKEVVVVVVALSTSAERASAGRRERTLAAQFLVLQLAVVAVLLTVVAVLSVRQSTADFTDEQGAQMRSVAEYTVSIETVRTQLAEARESSIEADATPRVLAPVVESAVQLSNASDVLVVDPEGVVVAASEPSLVGQPAELGESDALAEGRQWTGDVELDGERAVAAHSPVLADDGTLLGIVVAQVDYPTVADRLTAAAPDLAVFLGIGALLGIVGTYAVSRIVKRRTRGLGATEIARLADHREALLHAIREGVVAVGTDQRVTMMNDAARTTLGLDGPDAVDPVGRPVAELGLDDHVVALLTGAPEVGEVQDEVGLVGDRVVVFNRREAVTDGRGIGSVTTLRDRTELLSLRSQLSSNLTITDTLRAQTHEFDNRLHTISGLVQLGEYDEVTALVGTLTRHRAEVSGFVSERLHDPAVAALVVAKHSVAAERGVDLALDPGSRLPQLPRGDGADLTTILGNLVDNAVDACAGVRDAQVELWVIRDGGSVHVRVRDNGPGVPPDQREAIFVRGHSSKPPQRGVVGGRGIGLPLVRLICAQRGGRVGVDDAPGGGAEFHVELPIGDAADVEVEP